MSIKHILLLNMIAGFFCCVTKDKSILKSIACLYHPYHTIMYTSPL